jgi:hypothetical protein
MYIIILCLTPLSAIFQLYHGDHFSGGSSRSTQREPPTNGKQLVNFITCSFMPLEGKIFTYSISYCMDNYNIKCDSASNDP